MELANRAMKAEVRGRKNNVSKRGRPRKDAGRSVKRHGGFKNEDEEKDPTYLPSSSADKLSAAAPSEDEDEDSKDEVMKLDQNNRIRVSKGGTTNYTPPLSGEEYLDNFAQ